MFRKIAAALGTVLVLVVLYAVATRPPAVVDMTTVTLDGDPEQWIAEREHDVDEQFGIIAGAEKRIRWHEPGHKASTDWSVVYFHGFSASRQELAPVPEMVADALGANLFETRLTGHGIERDALHFGTAENWLADGIEGLAIGAAIGNRVAVIGASTGATLALALTQREEMQPVAAMVLISPNVAPVNSQAEFMTWPGGLDLAKLTVGPTRSWTPRNDLQARYWTTSYPMEAIVEMMRLVKYLRSRLPMSIGQRLMTVYSHGDTVVDAEATLAALSRIDAPQNVTWEISGSEDADHHVLFGDILSPGLNEQAASAIADFILHSTAPDGRGHRL